MATEAPDKEKEKDVPLPGDEPDGDDQEETLDVFIVGTKGQTSLNVGGKKPSGSKLKLPGNEIDVEGQFDKGDVVDVKMRLRIGEVALRDNVDPATGDVTGGPRVHKAKLVGRPEMLGKASDAD